MNIENYENLICTNCGAQVELVEDKLICKVCGSIFEKKQISSKLFVNLEQAQNERQSANFTKAKEILTKTILEFPNEDLSGVYWNLVLCEQSVIFETDGKGKKFPSFYNINSSNITETNEYKNAIEYAKRFNNGKDLIFSNLANQIENSKNIYQDISKTTKPYDIFICFKKSDFLGNTTPDTQLALDIYNQFSNKYKIFFSEKTLSNIKSKYREYEPNIYYGLYTSRVMLLICSSKEYLESTWLKNEWSRFTKINKQNSVASIIPIFMDGFNPSDLPENLWHIQGVKEDINLILNLQNQLESILHPVDELEELKKQQQEYNKKFLDLQKSIKQTPNIEVKSVASNQGESLLKRAKIFLEDEEYSNANTYADKVLDLNPECAEAYIVKLLARLNLKDIEDLINNPTQISKTKEYENAIKFADDSYGEYLNDLNDELTSIIKEKDFDGTYNKALELYNQGYYEEAMNKFNLIINYKDSREKEKSCIKNLEEEKLLEDDIRFIKAKELIDNNQYKSAIEILKELANFNKIKKIINDAYESLYNNAINLKNNSNYADAFEIFEFLKNYKDSQYQKKEILKTEELIYNNVVVLKNKDINKKIEKLSKIKNYEPAYKLLKQLEAKKSLDGDLKFAKILAILASIVLLLRFFTSLYGC